MSDKNNIDLNKLAIILNMVKNNEKKNETNENNLLKINSTNNLKSILPLVTENNENLNKILNYVEINQLINKYKEASKNIDNEQKLNLKKEVLVHIKDNINEKNKYLVDMFFKAIEIKHIMENNHKRGDI